MEKIATIHTARITDPKELADHYKAQLDYASKLLRHANRKLNTFGVQMVVGRRVSFRKLTREESLENVKRHRREPL